MELPTWQEAENVARRGQLLDEVAKKFRDFIVTGQTSSAKTPAVQFEPIDGDKYNFKAIVHRVELMIRYEQEIDMGSMEKRLRGVIRAYLHEPLTATPPRICSIWFNQRGQAVSPGDKVDCLNPDKEYEDNVRFSFAVLLAQHVQARISVTSETDTSQLDSL